MRRTCHVVLKFQIYIIPGHLDRVDFKCAFIYLIGVKPNKAEVALMFAHVGAHDDQILQSQFVELLLPYVLRRSADECSKEMFDAFDVQRTGFISRAAFRDVCASVDPALAASTVEQAFAEIDAQRYGRVSLRQFAGMLHEHAAKKR